MPEASIIIVDDEEGVARLCKRLLERANYSSVAFNDPAEAVAAMMDEHFDVLLVDIRMPGMDGFQVIEKARQTQPEIAVVIMTGFGTLETAIRALRQGADGLILKPFEEGMELIDTIKEALQKRMHVKEMARLRAIRPLLDMTETMFSETRNDPLLDMILNAIVGNIRCDHAAIYHRKAGDSFLHLVGSRGKVLPEEHSRAEAGMIGRADHWKVPIWINQDGPGENEFRDVLVKQKLGAVICTPVPRGESGLVFMAGRDQEQPAFQLADVETFGLLARQADVALENARLYGELRQSLRQIEESQRALIQAEKMSAVGRLTASIAHEVNNPLQAVSNCLHLVSRSELKEEERNDYLSLAQEELDRLMNTVQRMLDFYRPGAIDREETDVNQLIDRVLTLLEKQLIDHNIKVEKSYARDLPLVIVVNNQIQQVFFNLVLNAIDAMPSGGLLQIETKGKKDSIEITFQDQGPGVPPEVRSNIFEPFMSTRDQGTGLGLSVSYGILTAHGGNLELISGKGEGACFKVTLPLKEAK